MLDESANLKQPKVTLIKQRLLFIIDEIDRLTNDNKKLLDMLHTSDSTLQSCTTTDCGKC